MNVSTMSTSPVTGAGLSQLQPVARQVVAQTQPDGNAAPANVVAGKSASSTQTQPAPFTASDTPTTDELKSMVNDIQSKVPATAKDLQFSIDQDSGKSVVTLTDRATKEVLWQVPSEVALRISRELDQFQKGTLVNRQA
jgi:flagellar protein FlaG